MRINACQMPLLTFPFPSTPIAPQSVWQDEEMLVVINGAKIFKDEKSIVDMVLSCSFSEAKDNFLKLVNNEGGANQDQVKQFVESHFLPAGSDLVPFLPPDFLPEPPGFLPGVTAEEPRRWALAIHRIWLKLARQIVPPAGTTSAQQSLLSLPNPLIIPGARFREVYYWDSYWVVRGLLVSKMFDTARGIVENLIFLGRSFGFIPNGSRAYYVNRSQPPLLSAMVRELCNAAEEESCLDSEFEGFLDVALTVLEQEYAFWTQAPHAVTVVDKTGRFHSLSRYYAEWDRPRPESFSKDSKLVAGLDDVEAADVFRELASAAESGWDFSSRWMRDGEGMKSIRTTSILPTDLNAFLLQMEKDMASLWTWAGSSNRSSYFAQKSEERAAAIDALLWNDSMGQWLDLCLPRNFQMRVPVLAQDCTPNPAVLASNFVPLWCGAAPPGGKQAQKVVTALANSGLVLPAGVATSLINTGEQWDYPNAWAPLQHMLIEGLQATNLPEGVELARQLSARWLYTGAVAFGKQEAMHEKYDARTIGAKGQGGEYEPQVGFGWTNGVALALLESQGWPEGLPFPKY